MLRREPILGVRLEYTIAPAPLTLRAEPRPPNAHMTLRTLSGRGALLAVAALLALPLEARVLARIDALAAAPAAPAQAPVAALRAAAAGASHVDARLGVPTFVRGGDAAATLRALAKAPAPKAALDHEAAARAHLTDLAGLYRIAPAEIAALPVHDFQRLDGGGAIVRFRGQVDGVEVFREQVNVLVDRAGGLVAIGGFALGAPAGGAKAAAEPAVSAAGAVAAALADWRFAPGVAGELRAADAAGGYTTFALPEGAASDDGSALHAARAKRVWFRLPDRLLPAFYVEVQVRDGAWPHAVDYYAYVVSEADGALLFRHDQTADAAFTYRAYAEATSPFVPLPGPHGRALFPHPTGTPDGVQPPFAPAGLVTLANAPFSRNDPWLADTGNRTHGNNVEAHTNVTAPDGFGPPGTDECNAALPVDGDLHACVSAPQTFDYAYDHAQAPNASRTQVGAAVTNLFYTNNWLHDWYYDAGFDEAAGNAQTDNFGRGGIAGDSIFAEAQDFSGSNNANMSTPADGQRPRMRMFTWTSSIALARVNAPAAVAGAKQAGTAEFGPQAFDLTAELVAALDAADADGPTTTDGCTPYANAAAVAGKIAFVDRGTCLFVVKAKNAQAAGAVGVLVANNVAPGAPGMAGSDAAVTIPVVSITQADGAAIRAALAQAPVGLRIARQSGVRREGALDNSLIAHEWGHYISNRLIANASGLTANQARGLGEGWADFHALLMLVRESDRALPGNANFEAAYPVNAYPLGGPDYAPDALNTAYYYGVRRYPYSRDMAKNPLTFRHIADGVPLPGTPPSSPRVSGANSEVHSTGEVWAAMLWECYSNLLLDAPRLTFAAAQDRMKRYLVAAYKLTPAEPTFTSARDALLAVMQAQDPADAALCMAGFAKRGAGAGAIAPNAYSEDNAGVVESFEVKAEAGAVVPAIEYRHAAFDHYFVTSIADEIAKLDNGTFVGWARTGESFNVYASAQPGTSDVCRFFSTAFGAKSSHFYTPDAAECAKVKQNPDWLFEAAVFAARTPDGSGLCPAGFAHVYRLYNNGQGGAPNHRYTTNVSTRGQMITQGWIPEGYGAPGVVMCAPP